MRHAVPALVLACLLSCVLGCASAGASRDRRTAHRPRSFRAAVADDDEMGYTRRARAYLRHLDRSIRVRIDGPRQLTARHDGHDVSVSLDRPYRSCTRDRESCDELTEEYLRSVAEMITRSAEDAAATPDRLRLAIRSAETIDTYRAQLGDQLISRALVADLHALVLVDFPESARPLLRDELASIRLDADAAYARARANVLEELGRIPVGEGLEAGSAAAISDGRYYESSRILDSEWLTELERASGAPLLVAVPTYDTVLIAHGADPMAPLALAAVSQELAAEAPRPLSSAVLRWTEGRFEPVTVAMPEESDGLSPPAR